MDELKKHLPNYLDYLKAKKYCDLSIRAAHYQINAFIQWLKESGCKEINKNTVENYKNHLINRQNKINKKKLSLRSQVSHLLALKQFYNYLIKTNIIFTNPFAVIETPIIYRNFSWKLLNEDAIKTALSEYKTDTPINFRNRTIIELLYTTGLRANELVNIKLDDIDYENEMIKIPSGKGDIPRVVPASSHSLIMTKIFIDEHRPQLLKKSVVNNTENQFLFLNNEGNKIATETLNKYINSVFGKEITAHCFRVACATHMLKHGADIRFIQQQLGHNDLKATEYYLKIEKSELKKIHKSSHPAERKKNYE